MPFVDRESELRTLSEAFATDQPHLIVVTGRRRVGKSHLIDEFLRQQGAAVGFRFLARKGAGIPQMAMFSQRLAEHFQDDVLARQPFANYDALFTYVAGKAASKRFVLAIDEFPYLVEENKALPSILQHYWDDRFSKTKLFLILCGSSMGLMGRLFSGRAPLYGRRTRQIFLRPFAFADCAPLFSDRLETAVRAYAAFGGSAAYAMSYDRRLSFDQNLERTIFFPSHFMFADVDAVLREEVREPRLYFSLLEAIADGRATLRDICGATGVPGPIAAKYLERLEERLRLVSREVPVTARKERSREGRYKIDDPYVRFWFRYVYPNVDRLERGERRRVLERVVAPTFDGFIGPVFEAVCSDLLRGLRDSGKSRVPDFDAIGRWWHQDQEIDLVGLDQARGAVMFCEVKWSRKRIGKEHLEVLQKKASHVSWGKSDRGESYVFISRGGFHPGARRYARAHGIQLITLDELDRMCSRAGILA
jgi:AAA+ ATPase superfamily predicted ATPase